MISFYPGPSKVYNLVPQFVADAYDTGILSVNHRSETFMQLVRNTSAVMKEKLEIPNDYQIFFTSSATECWQIIAQAYNMRSYHFYNGAFGQKWFEHTKKLKKWTSGHEFDMHKVLKMKDLEVSDKESIICLTQNETSNGTQISSKKLKKIRAKFPKHLIAVDATSSMAGNYLKFKQADIWYASVQKCFGLPAGMAVLICSPRAIEVALEHNNKSYYNSLVKQIEMMQKWQTTHTLNVLSIYLLLRTMQEVPTIAATHEKLQARLNCYLDVIMTKSTIKPLIKRGKVRSDTVLTISASSETVAAIKQKAIEHQLLLGNGYGQWSDTTFRIANFPAITDTEFNQMISFLQNHIE